MRDNDREVGMMTIMWAPVGRRVAVQRKRYKQVSSTLHGHRHAGCALSSLWKGALCYGTILTGWMHVMLTAVPWQDATAGIFQSRDPRTAPGHTALLKSA